ncbi:uncharacterized protein PAC_06197 [Phialocephala subalpina]|uniref:Aminoglycoside phosphotransferase domain-containing protein n=1 Tax=Phialocephala subalpina TaxID=576137 RepID=A0A1L7WU75_9HELO|nr:uncharacterized protein PAC_06197 [Phialocephala subalpina]
MDWDLSNVPLQPSIDETVGLTKPGCWSIGSLMICEILLDETNITPDIVCSWKDTGIVYCLRKRLTPKTNRDPEGDFITSRHPKYYGASRGIWNLSPNVFCKAKSWVEGLTTEATTIRWINNKVPSIPTEKVLYDWIDPMWNRTIMISERVLGKTYQEAWPSLTMHQKLSVADQVAKHLKALSEMTSDYVETVQGTGLVGAWSLRVREPLPFWKPRVEPRVSRDDYEAYIKRQNDSYGIKIIAPNIGQPLVLQHSDCNPTNFLVTIPSNIDDQPIVTGIIDWEGIGYLPKWRIATCPRLGQGLRVETNPPVREGNDWQWMLSNACVRVGFPLELDYIKESVRKRYSEEAVKHIIVCDNLPTEV